MSYRLRRSEEVAESVERIAREQLAGAIRGLPHATSLGAVHDVRKRLKKLRAVLRLVRSGLEDKAFERENEAFRHIGQGLAALRDSDVLVQAVGNLSQVAGDDVTISRILAAARSGRREARRNFLANRSAATELHRAAVAARGRIGDWAKPAHADRAIVEGLRRSYARARKTFARAQRTRDSELWHEWRKRAKDFGYHLRLLENVWPAMFLSARAECQRLTDVLGELHDLAGVETLLGQQTPEPGTPRNPGRLTTAIARRKRALESRAREHASLLFEQKPKVFARHLQGSWTLWRG